MAVKREDFHARYMQMVKLLNLTQSDVAERTGLSKSLISRYTNNKVYPNVTTIGVIAQAFGINPVWLCGYDVPMIETTEPNPNLKKLQKRIADLTEDQRDKIISIIDILYPLENKKKD